MTDPQRPTVIFLMGPTASGKTALAIELAKRLPCDIICVDSALVYRGMDIGTAKPTAIEQAEAPHRLLDLIDPSESYSAADFRRDALREIESIVAQDRIPLLVGGTMLYYKALLEGLSPLPAADPLIRQAIETEAEQIGWDALHQQPQRLSRALEVYRISGKTLTELTQTKGEQLPYRTLQFAIASTDRELLRQRIAERYQLMLSQGFEQEVRALYQRGDLNVDLPSIRCVGYRQMWEYLDGQLSYDEMVYRGIVATCQLAKRQMTWLRGWQNVTWLETGAANNADIICQSITSA